MAADLSIIVDSNQFKVFGPNTTVSPWTRGALRDGMYEGTSWYARDPGSFLFYFNGTSVAVIGIFPSSPSQRPTVTIDNETVFSVNYGNPWPFTYGQWFQSPKLVDGFHVISANCSNETTLDFAIVNVGTQTNLTGSTIVVDNDSPSISYSGHWSRNTSGFNSTYLGGYPYGNSTHRSSTPGDTFTFHFKGTSVSVYGMFSWFNLGALSATYTLDGATIPQTRNVTSIRPSTNGEVPNFLHYSVHNLSAGNHTLIVNITLANNHTFVLDYITYTPSFETLSSMPFLSNTTPTTTSLSVNSSTSSGNPSSQPSQVQTSGAPRPSLTVAVVGGVIGVLVLVLVTILGRSLILRRRKAKQTGDISLYLYDYHQHESDANNQHIPNPNGKQQQHMQQLQPQRYPQPEKFRTLNLATQATDSHLRSSPNLPPNTDDHPVAEVAAYPPDYDDFSARAI